MTTFTARVTSAAIAAVAALTFAGCGVSPTAQTPASPAQAPSQAASSAASGSGLQKMVDSIQEEVRAYNEANADKFTTTTVTAEGDSTLVYTYVFRNQLKAASAAPVIQKSKPTLQKYCDDSIFPAMKQYGVENPVVVYRYLNADETTIVELTLTPSGS